MVSAKGLEPVQESRVKLGLLPWPNVQLSLSFTTSPSCPFLPPRKPEPARQGPILGPECCVSISQGLEGVGRG